MRVLQSKAVALFGAAILIVAACGSSAPDPVDPVGGVAVAFENAKSGGSLKQMELVTCLVTGGAYGNALGGLLGGLTGDALGAAGLNLDELSAAYKIKFEDLKTTETSRSGDTATVRVNVKVTAEVDAGKMRDWFKKYAESAGIPMDDAAIDAAMSAQLDQLTQSQTIDQEIKVVQQDGKWVACGSGFGAAAPGGTPSTAGNTTAPTEVATATEVPSSEPRASSTAAVLTATGDAIAIAAGNGFACALLSNGAIRCWGANGSGQLGNGSTTSSDAPVDVVGLTSGVRAIAAGYNYACALTNGGGVKCWGDGAVGHGSTAASTTPVDVIGLTSGVSAITAGYGHACAVTSGGGVKCWGGNRYGELGDGSTTSSDAPVNASVLGSGVMAIAAGSEYTCVLTSGGGVKCWGYNAAGQLGNGSTTNSSTAVDVVGLASGISAITAGAGYTCALSSGGGAKCWGYSGRAIPFDIPTLTSGVDAIYTSLAGVTCAITDGGGVKCWPSGADDASDVQGLPGLNGGVSAVALGSQNAGCLLLTSGGVTCADGNSWVDVGGLTATSTGGQTSSPTTGAPGNTTAIAIGFQHTCALTSGGGIKCWGFNSDGPLGTGSTGSSETPVDVFGLASGVKAIGAGFGYTCAVTGAGGVKCWGRNGAGQLGTGTTANSLIPVDVSGLASGIGAIALGFSHACALSTTGAVKCWGENGARQLGNGTGDDSLVPIDVNDLSSGVKAIAADGDMTCALTAAGGVKCWGTGVTGNGLGGNASLRNDVPVDVVGLTSGVTAIALGSKHTCAVVSGGGVKCWGVNSDGELGNGTTKTEFPYTPVDVVGLTSGTRAIAAGETHTCALTSGGGVKCWGANNVGQLGNGTTASSSLPVDVAGLSSGVKAISAGNDVSCAITIGGLVKCWGAGYGTTPVDVVGL